MLTQMICPHIRLSQTLCYHGSVVLMASNKVVLATTELFDTYLLNFREKKLIRVTLTSFILGCLSARSSSYSSHSFCESFRLLLLHNETLGMVFLEQN